MMLIEWKNRTDKILCFLSLFFNLIAVLFIPFWFKYSAWLISETNCVTNVDWNNKVWRPCALKLRLQERCVFINRVLVHCDHWDHLGVTIHLINIPMQTERIPSEGTAEIAEFTIIGLVTILFFSILFTFISTMRKFTAVCNSLLTLALMVALYSIQAQLADAVVDHRPTVRYGRGLTLFMTDAVFVFIGTALMITRMLYVSHKNKSKETYAPLSAKEPETVEMAVQEPRNENDSSKLAENVEVNTTVIDIPQSSAT